MDDIIRATHLPEAMDEVIRARSRSQESFRNFFEIEIAENLHLANFVFQGGGVLGIAHVGFLYGMEAAGVRVAGTAGTSAGAIISVLIAAARRNLVDPVAATLAPILWQMPAKSFIDGPYRIRRLIKHLLRGNTPGMEMWLPAFSAFRRFLRVYGLNSGNAFQNWLADALVRHFDIRTVHDLDERLKQCEASLRKALAGAQWSSSNEQRLHLLRVVTTGLPQAAVPISIGRKFVFPEDMPLFSPRYMHQSPALLARASMSVPVFFEPLLLDLVASQWKKDVEARFWDILSEGALADLTTATSVAFLDGGLLSNFPVDAFLQPDAGELAKLPTVGVALAGQYRERYRRRKHGVAAASQHIGAAVDAMRHVRDRDARALSKLIGSGNKAKIALVDAGSHNWLNFQLDEAAIGDLFVRGVRGAAQFIGNLAGPS